MVLVLNNPNTQTGAGHDLEVVDITTDHEAESESETAAGVRPSGTLVPHHRSLTFTNSFPLENTGLSATTYRRKET